MFNLPSSAFVVLPPFDFHNTPWKRSFQGSRTFYCVTFPADFRNRLIVCFYIMSTENHVVCGAPVLCNIDKNKSYFLYLLYEFVSELFAEEKKNIGIVSRMNKN